MLEQWRVWKESEMVGRASAHTPTHSRTHAQGDADNPDRITSKSFGTVQLFMQPKPPNAPPEKKKTGDDDEDEGAYAHVCVACIMCVRVCACVSVYLCELTHSLIT